MKFGGFGSSGLHMDEQAGSNSKVGRHVTSQKKRQDVTFGPKLDARGNLQIEGRPIVKLLSNQAKYSLSPGKQTHFYDKCFSSVVWVAG